MPVGEALGHAAVRGTIGGGWAVRAERIRALMAHLFGAGGPGELPSLEPPAPAPPAGRPLGPRRAELERAGRALGRALLARDLPALAPRLAEKVWVAWPDGALGLHPRAALLSALEARPGAPAPLEIGDLRSYDRGEIRAAHARGVGQALAFLGPGPWVTMGVDGPDLEVRRILLVAASDAPPARFGTLALGAPDEARIAGAKPTLHASRAVRLADAFARARLGRHGRSILDLRGRLTPRVLVEGRELKVDALARELDEGPPAFEANESVVEGVEPVAHRTVETWLGAAELARLRRRAPDLWHRAWEDLRPTWVAVTQGEHDAVRGRLVKRTRLLCLVVEALDPDGSGERRPRARLALATSHAGQADGGWTAP